MLTFVFVIVKVLLYKHEAIFHSIAYEIFTCVHDLPVTKYRLSSHSLLLPSEAVYVFDQQHFSMLHKFTVD